MSEIWILQLVTYVSLAVLIIGVAVRTASYARAPLRLRWETYPGPGEEGKGYRGSYMEELDWWTKPRGKPRVNELRAMLTEILLVKSLWRHKRRLWYVSYPLHGGIYLIVLPSGHSGGFSGRSVRGSEK